MFSLPPSIAPRSVPLTQMPPPRRASRTALLLAVAAWVLLAVPVVFAAQLTDEVARPETWRPLVRKVLLIASACAVLASFVTGLWGFTRSKVASSFALALVLAWIGVVSWHVMH